jgi:hypothetical protein
MGYRQEVWRRTRRDWRLETEAHLTWHISVAVGGAGFGLYLAFRMKVPTLSLAEWVFPVVGALASLVIMSLVRLVVIRAHTATTIYDELRAGLAVLESEYKATHPRVQVALESISRNNGASLSIVNSGSAADFRATLVFIEGAFQPAIHGGPFLAQWPDGHDHMVIPNDSTHSLRIASLETDRFTAQWTIHYFDHGTVKTARLFYISEIATPATIKLELQANPAIQGGPVSKVITFLGAKCLET